VAVVLSGETLAVTLHGALSPADGALARTPEGAGTSRQSGAATVLGGRDSRQESGSRSP